MSLALIGGSIVVFALRGEKNFGIDFRGGDLLVVDSKQPVTVAEARGRSEGIGLGDVVIQFERAGMQDSSLDSQPAGHFRHDPFQASGSVSQIAASPRWRRKTSGRKSAWSSQRGQRWPLAQA